MTTKRKPPLARDPVLERYAKRIRVLAKRTADNIIEIGELFEKVKKRVGHGGWLPWLEHEGYSEDSAQRFMRVRELVRKNRKLRNLSASVLYELSKKSTPQEAINVIAARAEAGLTIPIRVVRQEVRQRQTGGRVSLDVGPPTALKPITAEDLQAGHRRQLIDLLVDVASQLPSDRSIEEARAVVVSLGRKRDSFSAAVGLLYDFIGELHRALIEVPPAPTLRVIPGKDD